MKRVLLLVGLLIALAALVSGDSRKEDEKSHHLTEVLRKEASIVKQEEIYTDFMDKFIDEFAEIIEKIEKETIPLLKNQERLNSSEETEKWAKLIEGRNLLYNLTQIFGQ